MLSERFLKMHDKVLLAGGQGGLKAGKYHWMIHAYQNLFFRIHPDNPRTAAQQQQS